MAQAMAAMLAGAGGGKLADAAKAASDAVYKVGYELKAFNLTARKFGETFDFAVGAMLLLVLYYKMPGIFMWSTFMRSTPLNIIAVLAFHKAMKAYVPRFVHEIVLTFRRSDRLPRPLPAPCAGRPPPSPPSVSARCSLASPPPPPACQGRRRRIRGQVQARTAPSDCASPPPCPGSLHANCRGSTLTV